VHTHRLGIARAAQLATAILEVLKSPTSSFFLVSTEIAGAPAAIVAFTTALMGSNCALRSGWLVPSRVLRLAWQLYLCSRSSKPTSFWLTAKP